MSPRTELRCVRESVILTPSLRSSCAADKGEWGYTSREGVVNKEESRDLSYQISVQIRHCLLEHLELNV